MPRILIAGCGYVGAATGSLFEQAGWETEGWTSSSESARQLGTMPFPVHAVDITSPSAVAAAATPVAVVIQCASSRGGDADDYRRIYLEGARNLSTSFPQALLLFTSSTSVYAQEDGAWVTEESPAEPERPTARVLCETEELVLQAGGIVARLAGVYGPGRSALLGKFLAGTAVIEPGADRFINQIHRDDIAAALLLLAQTGLDNRLPREPGAGRIFNIADNHPISHRECYEWLASRLNRPLPPASPTSSERRRGNSNKRVSSAKLRALGWSPRYPTFQAAMTESILPSWERGRLNGP